MTTAATTAATTGGIKGRRLELNMEEAWSAFIFLALALLMVTWSMSEAGYGEGLSSLVFVTLGAIAASLFLTKSRLPWVLAHLFSLIYGISWISFVISYQLPSTFTARDKLLELGYRIGSWFQQSVLGGGLGTDPLMFVIVMSFLFWLMAYLAIWFSFRAHALWAALLPGGVTLVLNLYYGPQRIAFLLVPYLLFVMLFMVRFNLYTHERGWKRQRVRYDVDIVYSFLRYGAITAILAIAFAWIVPAAAASTQAEVFLSRFTEPWDRLKDEWIRLFSTLQSERVQPGTPTFGAVLALGGPVNLGNVTLMDVQANAGRYWKAAVYDRYTGKGWSAMDTDTLFLEAGAQISEATAHEARRVITQTYTIYTPNATQLYALGNAERFSLPIKASVIQVQSPEGEPLVAAISMINSRYALNAEDSYLVVSDIPSGTEDAMRLAGDEYPEWIDPYLQLPDELPQRVRDLALEITADQDNAYDKANALQDYLREYTYNEQVKAPPADADGVDYFLFESKEGYCNYYASAMAVMARAVGIPARVAAGYAQGDWEREVAAYRVREHHSHAWVEVYLPRFGWIEFEPTANEPVLVRPRIAGGADQEAGSAGAAVLGDQGIPEDEFLNPGAPLDPDLLQQLLAEQRRQERIRTWTRVGGVLGVSLVIILLAWWLGRRRMDEEHPAAIYYERMVRRGTFAGFRMQLPDTPHEYAARLSTSLNDPESDRLVGRITDAYVGERYGNKNPARFQPDFAWRDLRGPLGRWTAAQLWRRLWGAG
jgi:transglutaminase-like putative cysteine protease